MERKKDAQMIKLERSVDDILEREYGLIDAMKVINERHKNAMIQMRDLLTKLIEGR